MYSDGRMQPARRVAAAVRCYFAPTTKLDDKWSGQVRFGTGGVRPTAVGGPASPAPTGGDVDAASIKRPLLPQCLRRRAASHEFDRFGRVRGKCERWCVGRFAPAKDVLTIGRGAGTLNENTTCHKV